jgi:hypothetical protein
VANKTKHQSEGWIIFEAFFTLICLSGTYVFVSFWCDATEHPIEYWKTDKKSEYM